MIEMHLIHAHYTDYPECTDCSTIAHDSSYLNSTPIVKCFKIVCNQYLIVGY